MGARERAAADEGGGGYRRWINATAALIKSLDANHLVTIGSEGRTPFPKSYVGMDFAVDHAFADIDYTTIHVWAQNWEWYNPDEGAPSRRARAPPRARVRP